MALEGFPPLILMGSRFLIAGSIMLAIAFAKKAQFPKGRQLWLTCLFGVMMLGIANGALTFAELWIPSSLAALMLTIGPFWLVGIEHASGGERINPRALVGLCVGFCGAMLLLIPKDGWGNFDSSILSGFLLLNVGAFFWNAGSVLQKRQKLETHPFVSGALHNFACGILFLPLGLMTPHEPVVWKMKSTLAIVYLVIFGSFAGFNCYIYALERLPVSIVSIYNYINPAVAVVLGVWFYNEPIGWREIVAMIVIFVGVAIVKHAHKD